MIDYRDRISVAVWIVLLGLTVTLLVKMPSTTLVWIAFGSPLSLQLSANTLLGALLVALTTGATEAVVRAHPRVRAGRLRNRWVFWALPCAVVLVAALLLPTAPTRLTWLAGLGLTAVVLGVTLAATFYAIAPEGPGYRPARIVLNLLTYAAVLILFLGVYRQRARSLFSATLIVGISTLLAMEVLRGSEKPLRLVALYALIVGVVLGEATWALNYWRLPGLTGGLLLQIGFYLLVGLAHQGLTERLTPRVLLEFGIVAAISLALIWLFAP
ncbi:MAG: hypothetical protein QHJ81_05065 [Anaerolineae bacterium]|nr:hypothetical protein [Anaerolineae bacterium]